VPSTISSQVKESIRSFIKTYFLAKLSWLIIFTSFAISLAFIPFNKAIFLGYPNFFNGKFNYFSTNSLILSEPLILASGLIFLSYKILTNKISETKLKKLNPFLILFFISLSSINHNIHGLSALIVYTNLKLSNKNEKKLILFTLTISLVLETTLALYQSLKQSSLGLSFLGEPVISQETKGLAKLYINSKTIFRSYGTFAHPNVFAAFLVVLLTHLNLHQKLKKTKTFLHLGLLTTFSLTASIALVLTNIFKLIKKKKGSLGLALSLSLIICLTIIGIRIQNQNFENISDRYQEIQNLQTNNNPNTILKKQPWEIVPIHNTYIYTQQAYGWPILLLLILTLIYAYKKSPEITILLGLMFFTDHFWLSLPQGTLLLAIAFGLSKPTHTKPQETTPENTQDSPLKSQRQTSPSSTQAE